jgi:hypothetical protein
MERLECWMCENFEDRSTAGGEGWCQAIGDKLACEYGVAAVSVQVRGSGSAATCPYFEMTDEARDHLDEIEAERDRQRRQGCPARVRRPG